MPNHRLAGALLYLFLTACHQDIAQTGPATAQTPAAPQTGAQSARPERFQGQLWVDYDPDTLEAASPQGQLLIRDAQAFETFLARIPRYDMSGANPMPPSHDLLLRQPAPDFQHEMLAVAIRGNSMQVYPRIEGVEEEAERLRVKISYPPLGETAHEIQPVGIGSYAALRLPRSDKPVEWQVVQAGQ